MEFIKGVTFGYMSQRGEWESQEAFESLRLLQERCAATHVILTVVVDQATIHATQIDWQSETVLSDQEVRKMIVFAQEIGLKVILKPMVNIADGMWRAHINFFDHDVPCEPKWSEWFSAYTEFITHYAKIAEETACELFVVGCELVNSDRREKEWREVISNVRNAYTGLITYNCDKYQEDNLTWWDAVDVLSSSGYYPIDKWEQELKRIEKVVEKEQKPFFFCEAGCASRTGSKWLPNNWELEGSVDLFEQKEWYDEMFRQTDKYEWIGGFGLWDWKAKLYPIRQSDANQDYAVYGKPAESTIQSYFKKK
ncbi:MAG: 1,4-beta-xylanase [Carnobacterium jeotgali]|uniref:glycoside hydrolase family 113 n=1 Tax=Carnobacterium jeotgali TaxID=545534 RepID=UPI00389068D7